MKTCFLALSVLLASPSFAQQAVPDIPFDSVPNFLKLPAGMNFGEVPGVAVKGTVQVRAGVASPTKPYPSACADPSTSPPAPRHHTVILSLGAKPKAVATKCAPARPRLSRRFALTTS